MRLLPRSAKSTLLMSQFRGVAVVDILLLWRFMRGKYLDHLVAGWPVQCPVLRQEYTNFKERVRYLRCSVGVSLSAPSGWHFGESQNCWCHPERGRFSSGTKDLAGSRVNLSTRAHQDARE